MTQQVNLLKEEFKPRKITFSFDRALFVIAASVVLMSLHGAWNLWQRSENTARAAEAKKAEQSMVQVYAKKKIEFSTNAIDPDIDAQLLQLEQQAKTKAELKGSVQRALNVTSGRFSPYLLALATHYRPEVWLENIYFQGNEQFLLEGYAVKSSDLVSYIDRLSGDVLFHGRLFDVFSLKKKPYLPPLERKKQEAQQQATLLDENTSKSAETEKPKEEYFAFQMSTGIARKKEEEDQDTPQAAIKNVPFLSKAISGEN